jgi:integrase
MKHADTTLEQLLDLYIDARSLKPRTVHEYKVVVDRHFEEWKTKKVTEITEKMVLAKHKEFTRIGKTTCNSAMRVLRALLRYANAIKITQEIVTDVLAKARMWHKPKRKDRIITSEDLPAWLDAVESLENIKTKTYFLTLLYMGFRSTELLSTKWENVNMRTHTIKLIDTKNGTDHTLPIPQVLWPYYKKIKAHTGKTPFVFPSDSYPELDQPLDRPKRAIKAVCVASGVEFSPHDCRRTFATIAEASGLTFTMIKRLLNHTTDTDVTTGYIVTENDTIRDAIERISATIKSVRNKSENT